MWQEDKCIRTFIGANAPRGASAHRTTLYDGENTDRVILIKGGAGNGKSTLMGRVAAAAEERGWEVERVYCPSDPKSLDGIVCPEGRFAMVDATPPHVWEPEAHCLPEEYLSLSPWVSRDVREKRAEITEKTEELKKSRREADKCISAAAEADSELSCEALTFASTGKLSGMGRSLGEKYLPKGSALPGAGGKRRFLSALAPGGIKTFLHTPEALCGDGGRMLCYRDSLGLSPFFLGGFCETAEKRGFSLWQFFDPLVPSRLVGVCVREAGLCLMPEEFGGESVADLGEAFSPADREEMGARPEVLTAVKTALLTRAGEALGQCLGLHDEIEALYRPYTDFAGLNALGDRLCAELTGEK